MRIVIVVLCLCAVLAGVGPGAPVAAAELVDQENLVSTTVVDPLEFAPRNQFWAQTFTPGITGELTTVRFGIGSNVAATVTIEVFELVFVNGAIPRTVLATATAGVAAGDCDPNNLVTFDFDQPAHLVEGREYFFAVYTNENTTNACFNANDSYAGGVAAIMMNDGPASIDPPLDPNATAVVLFITSEQEGDYVFQTYIDPTDAVLIEDLLGAVGWVPISGAPRGGATIRLTLLAHVYMALAFEQRGHDAIACRSLDRFEGEVEIQMSKRRISRSHGAVLLDQSGLILSELGCNGSR